MEELKPISRKPGKKAALLETVAIGTATEDMHDVGKGIAAALLMGQRAWKYSVTRSRF